MNIKLTHEQKIALLEAVQCGFLDTSILEDAEKDSTNIEDIEREIIRLEMFDGNMLARAELMRQYAMHEITQEEYISQRIGLIKNT